MTADEVVSLIARMQFVSEKKDENTVVVTIPPSRPDVLHICDVIEDVAVAYGRELTHVYALLHSNINILTHL